MSYRLKVVAVLVMVFVIAACAHQGSNPRKRVTEFKTNTYNIKGEVVWEGEKYIVYPMATASYRGVCGKRKGIQVVRISAARVWYLRILDIAVWLEPVWEEMTPDEIDNLKLFRQASYSLEYKIAEKECEFVPRLTVVPVGSRVEVVNEDRKDHWLVIEGDYLKRQQYIQVYDGSPPVFTLETPRIHHVPEGAPIVFDAKRADKWHLQSGFHNWMEGWVLVTDKIRFTKVNDDGYFRLEDIPRGVYRVNTWHPLLGFNSTVVRVPDDTRRVVKVGYKEAPEDIEFVTSSHISTEGEVREEGHVWQEIEDW